MEITCSIDKKFPILKQILNQILNCLQTIVLFSNCFITKRKLCVVRNVLPQEAPDNEKTKEFESLPSNHDNDGGNNVTNLHINFYNGKVSFQALYVLFLYFCTFHIRSRSINDVQLTCILNE